MRHLFFTFLTVLTLSSHSFEQEYRQNTIPDSLTLSLKRDSLELIYGKNKVIPVKIDVATLYVLSYYPELKNTKIIFKEKRIKTTLNVRPTFFSLIFRKKAKRKYIVRINNSNETGKIMINEVPFTASIGLLGHEFAHIADYNSKGFFGVVGRGFSYLSKRKKAKYEKEIDNLTIERGLGKALYSWSYFVLNQSYASEEYKEFKRETYLTPDDIMHAVKE